MTDHYFSSAPTGSGHRTEVQVDVWGTRRTYQTAGGVFAKEGLDKATSVLLRHSSPPQSPATVLDLGCGWGPIACSLAAEGLTVWAVDVNERALELTRANAERHGLAVEVCHPDEVPADLRFDAIWSNPPIRIGKAALHDLLDAWLARLTPDGEARLVVGKNLGSDSLQRWLNERGHPTTRAISEKGFRVLSVRPGADPVVTERA